MHLNALSLTLDYASSVKSAGVIPATIQKLKVRCTVAAMLDVLAMISDEGELPQLSAIPDLDYVDKDYDPWRS